MKSKHKILIDLERLRYPNSGIANVANSLTKGLLEINSLSLDLYGPTKLLKRRFPKAHNIAWRTWHKIFGVNLSPYNIVQVSYQSSRYFWHVPKHCLKVVVVHDLNFLYESISEKKRRRLMVKMQRCLREAYCVVCISDFVKNDFIKHRDLFDLPKLKFVTTIYNGLNFKELDGMKSESFPELNGKKYILNIGVLMDKKNQLSLIRMLAFIDYDLVLVQSEAKEEYYKKIDAEINRLNLTHRVHIYQNISCAGKQFLLKNCVAMCHPSIAEGFGIPPIEAMYFGKPVFLAKRTSLPEIGGSLAFYFNDFDPKHMADIFTEGMTAYKAEPALKEKLIERAKTFDYHVMAKRYNTLYLDLLKSNS